MRYTTIEPSGWRDCMRRWGMAGAAGLSIISTLWGALAATSDDPPPDWAFVIYQKADDEPAPPALVTVPGSKLQIPSKALDDRFDVPDWFPEDHAQPPGVVLHGHAPTLTACSYCHLPTGVGNPEDAAI